MRHDVGANVCPELHIGGPVGRNIEDDPLGCLVGHRVEPLLKRLAERDDRGIPVHNAKPLLAGDCTQLTTVSPELRAPNRCAQPPRERVLLRKHNPEETDERRERNNQIERVPHPADEPGGNVGAGRDVERGRVRRRRPGSSRRARRSRSVPDSPVTPGGSSGAPRASPPSSPAPPPAARSSRRPRATGASPTLPGSATGCSAGVLQGYLAVGETVDGLITDADVDWRAERRARLAAVNVLDALAPTNFAWSNPTVLEEIVDTGGGNLVRGRAAVLARSQHSARLPATVDTSKFEVGGNLAATPGSVVLRTEVFELIQYKPATEQVREVPLLFVPPTINKFYVLDLAPGRSMIEHSSPRDSRCSRSPGATPSRPRATSTSIRTRRRSPRPATRSPRSRRRAGSIWRRRARAGSITAGLLGHLAATGELDEVASLTLMVCALDNDTEGTLNAFATRDVAAAAVAESARKGYLDGQALAGVFTWLRPNDLVWNYVVNNYLLGKAPPAFDILYWNQDTVRLAAGLHRDFIHLGLDNSFAHPRRARGARRAGRPRRVDVDTYFIAGANDHIVPWESAYKGAQLFGGSRRFVLSRSGHIQALVNPPARDRARSSFRVADDLPDTPEEFARPGTAAAGQLVAGLGRVAGRALRRDCSRRPRRSATRRTRRRERRRGPMYSLTDASRASRA